MADGDPPAVTEAFGQRADVIDVQRVGGLAEVEMHVDVDVIGAREGEHAVDLAVRIAVGIGRRADHPRAPLQRLHHEVVGARIVEQPFLREDADLDVDRPAIVVDQWQNAVEAAQADSGIDLQMGAQVGCALPDAHVEHAACPAGHVLFGEGALDRGDPLDRLCEIAALHFAAVEDAGLVEMDMGLDEAGRDEVAVQIKGRRVGFDGRRDGGDVPTRDADVEARIIAAGDTPTAQNQVHPRSFLRLRNTNISTFRFSRWAPNAACSAGRAAVPRPARKSPARHRHAPRRFPGRRKPPGRRRCATCGPSRACACR